MNGNASTSTAAPRHELVGVITLVALVLGAAAFLSAGQVQQWLNPGKELKVVLPDEGLFGLAEGAEVQVLGTTAGRVSRIVIEPDQQIHADIRIRNDMASFIRSDSTAAIRKRFGVAGEAYLAIERGTGAKLDWEYAVIEAVADTAPTESLQKIVNELRTRVIPLVDQAEEGLAAWTRLGQTLGREEGDVLQMVSSLRTITRRLEEGEGSAGRLLTNDQLVVQMEQALAGLNEHMKDLEPILADLKETTDNTANISEELNLQVESLPEIAKNLREMLDSLNTVMQDMRQTTPRLPAIAENVEKTSRDLPSLIAQTETMLLELETLIKQLQSNWLIGGQREQPAPERISPLEIEP